MHTWHCIATLVSRKRDKTLRRNVSADQAISDTSAPGNVHEYGTPEFNEIVASQNVTIIPGTRSIIVVDIHQVGTSCGFSMPCYEFVSFRPTLNDFFEKRVANEKAGKRKDGIEVYVCLAVCHAPWRVSFRCTLFLCVTCGYASCSRVTVAFGGYFTPSFLPHSEHIHVYSYGH